MFLAIWDIDSFKLVNDTYGHDVGDKILISVSQSLKKINESIGWVARFGGDEFVIVFNSENQEECEFVLQSIKKEIDNKTHIFTSSNNNRSFKVSVSYGLSNVSNANDAEEAISMADKTLYRCKQIVHHQ